MLSRQNFVFQRDTEVDQLLTVNFGWTLSYTNTTSISLKKNFIETAIVFNYLTLVIHIYFSYFNLHNNSKWKRKSLKTIYEIYENIRGENDFFTLISFIWLKKKYFSQFNWNIIRHRWNFYSLVNQPFVSQYLVAY